MIDITQWEYEQKVFAVCLYFARMPMGNEVYKTYRKQYYEQLAAAYPIGFGTIKNHQDRLDAQLNKDGRTYGRKGWHQRPLERENRRLWKFYLDSRNWSDELLQKIVDYVMAVARGEVIEWIPASESEDLADRYTPNLETIMGDFAMESEPLQTLAAFLNQGKHSILSGPPGTGKTSLAERACEEAVRTNYINGHILTTATTEWSTFDTIGGYMPNVDGTLSFREGMFLRSIRENKWLIVDEINRAEIDKALGQLFTVLSGKDVDLPFKAEGDQTIRIKHHSEKRSYYDSDACTYYIGKNWRIIATMNTFDKNSLFMLSYALMRRFAFVEIEIPQEDLMSQIIQSVMLKSEQKVLLRTIHTKSPKPLGPAIIRDLADFLMETQGKLTAEGICGLILPQFEGLGSTEYVQFYEDIGTLISNKDREKIKKCLVDFFNLGEGARRKMREVEQGWSLLPMQLFEGEL